MSALRHGLRRSLRTALLAAAATPLAAHAQTLQGLVRDRVTQQPLANAEITLVNTQGEAAGTTRSEADGSYFVAGDSAGQYRLAARKPGYQVMLSNTVQLEAGQVLQVEARLTPQEGDEGVGAGFRAAAERGITGRVAEAGTGHPVADASVALLNQHGQHMTRVAANEQGEFHVLVPRPGRYQLRAERVGYQRSTSQAITVVPSDTVRVELLLSSDAVVLAPLTVVASSRSVVRDARMAGFQWRSEHHPWGRFVGPEQIRRIRPAYATDVLNYVAGVQVGGSGVTRTPTMRGRLGSRCVPTFYVDGHPSSEVPLNDLVGGGEVAAVEVYVNAFSAPVEFMPSANRVNCGVIVVWTRPPGQGDAG